jgi:inosine-uridine nucleoside N-ribohydrolase
MDDQWALAHLALSPEFDLRGVVTTHAPNLAAPAAETSAACAEQVLDHLSLTRRPPVFAGSSVPLSDRVTPRLNAGVDFLVRQSCDFLPENRLTVLVIGAATDIASALLADPAIEERIEIVAMGFQSLEVGGDEWNVKNDVRAWQTLLDSRAKIVVGDAAVCKRRLLMTVPQAAALCAEYGEAGRFLTDLLIDWLRENPSLAEAVTGRADTWPIWDQVTVGHLLGVTTCRRLPRPRLRDDLTFAHAEDAEPSDAFQWITEIDAERLWNDLVRKLSHAQA